MNHRLGKINPELDQIYRLRFEGYEPSVNLEKPYKFTATGNGHVVPDGIEVFLGLESIHDVNMLEHYGIYHLTDRTEVNPDGMLSSSL